MKTQEKMRVLIVKTGRGVERRLVKKTYTRDGNSGRESHGESESESSGEDYYPDKALHWSRRG